MHWILRLRPAALVAEVRGMIGSELDLRYPNGLLIVELGSDVGVLEVGLQACRAGEAEATRLIPALGTMDFHTAMEERARPRPAPAPVRPLEVRSDGPLYALPLGKRPGCDRAFADRVSVGRARNKDVVLRNGSVSKFHAWFQVDEEKGLQIVDAGSKNGTSVNDELVEPRQPRRIRSGDRVQFGRVDTLWLSSSSLRDLLSS